jgi:hypothetical protein
MKTAIYDLSKMPTTFDFVAWAVIASTVGCEHVHFISEKGIAEHKYPKDIAWRRFANILVPICKIAGMDFSVGSEMEGISFTYFYKGVTALYNKTRSIKKLAPADGTDKSGFITITNRASFRNVYRNSNVEAWSKFAEYAKNQGYKVVILNECEHAPLNVEYRLALYCDADMNLGASGGPMALCHFSDAPYITMNMNPKKPENEVAYENDRLLALHGLSVGDQLAWSNEDQYLVWKPDTFENIVEAFENAMQKRKAA